MHAASLRSSVNLCALFAALLSGCAARPIDSDSDTEGEGTTTDTSGETSGTGTTTDATTTVAMTTSTTDATTSTVTTVAPTTDFPECPPVEEHILELTPEEYEHWLEHGEPPPQGGTTGGETSGEGTTDANGTTEAMQTSGVDSTGAGTTGGEELSYELCAKICAHETGYGEYEVVSCQKDSADALGNVTIVCKAGQLCEGRRHACIESRGVELGADPVGAFFARAAHDEAASVYAFVALGRELAEHGAPAQLLARIRDAAADEVRHARAAVALARRHGGTIQRPRRSAHGTRSLLEIARENAVEGCVRETWAALSAAHQARCAEDPQIRAAMAAIADDEARHAELAWALDAWLSSGLSDSERAEVEAARRAAADELVQRLSTDERDASLVRRAGVPDRAAARRLSAGLAGALWSAA